MSKEERRDRGRGEEICEKESGKRQWGSLCQWGKFVNGLVGASNRNYFSQNTPFSILQLFEPLVLNFFSLDDLKHNLPHTSQSLIFMHLQNGFFFF